MHVVFFFFNDTATTEIYTLSLHDALPIYPVALVSIEERGLADPRVHVDPWCVVRYAQENPSLSRCRSEEHTSELQSRQYLVCRLLLEKKKKNRTKLCT